MTAWTSDELSLISSAKEIEITTYRADGSLRSYMPIWIVRDGDDLYVRSYRGRAGSWFRHGLRMHEGRIRADGLERDVAFEEPEDSVDAALDRAYEQKYGRNGYVDAMLAPAAVVATFRLLPR